MGLRPRARFARAWSSAISQQKKLTMKLECRSTPYLATIYFGHSLVICKARLGMHYLVRNAREMKVTS